MDPSTRWIVIAAVAVSVSVALRLVGSWVESRSNAFVRDVVKRRRAQWTSEN